MNPRPVGAILAEQATRHLEVPAPEIASDPTAFYNDFPSALTIRVLTPGSNYTARPLSADPPGNSPDSQSLTDCPVTYSASKQSHSLPADLLL